MCASPIIGLGGAKRGTTRRRRRGRLRRRVHQRPFHVPVGQAEPQVPANRDDDHLRWNPGRRTRTAEVTTNKDGLTPSPSNSVSIMPALNATDPTLSRQQRRLRRVTELGPRLPAGEPKTRLWADRKMTVTTTDAGHVARPGRGLVVPDLGGGPGAVRHPRS